MPIRVGFLIGCDDDMVEDRKYKGDVTFLKDLPDRYRIDPKTHEYLLHCKKGTRGVAHADVAIPWRMRHDHADIEVDLIPPEEITVGRLRSNDINVVLGYDLVNASFEGVERRRFVERVFRTCGNLMPPLPFQDHIYYKSRYLQACLDAGVPTAPTFFVGREGRSAAALLERVRARGWKTFVLKQSFSAFACGFLKVKTEDAERKPKILEDYFADYADAPEFIVQEAIPGFQSNWETRCFWWNGEFLYAIANKAAVSSETGKEVIVTGDDIPPHFLREAKRVGRMAIATLPQLTTPKGQPIGMKTLIRTDIGCSDTKLDDVDCRHWRAGKKTFFLNELEFGSINLFIRHLPFDAVPLWSEKIAEAAREVCSLDGGRAKRKAGAASAGQVRRLGARAVSVKPNAALSTASRKTVKKVQAKNKSSKRLAGPSKGQQRAKGSAAKAADTAQPAAKRARTAAKFGA